MIAPHHEAEPHTSPRFTNECVRVHYTMSKQSGGATPGSAAKGIMSYDREENAAGVHRYTGTL